MSRTVLDIGIRSIEGARKYTLLLLDGINEDEWFRQPAGGVTHMAWQVGHLAMAQYALTMLRIRGKEPEDQEIISNDFFRCFKKGTEPVPDATQYPPIDEILEVFHRVHHHALDELAGYEDEQLNEKLPEPHVAFSTKMGSIYFCPAHEMLHAGQIGLVRRLIGKEPVR